MQAIPVTIRAIGNSKGIVLPKPILVQAGLDESTEAELLVENGVILLRRVTPPVRQGWAQAAAQLAAQGGDALVMGEFGNEADEDLAW